MFKKNILLKKAVLSIGFFFIYCSFVFCQQQKTVDSLVTVYETGNYKKSDKLKLLQTIAESFTDPEKILFYSEALIQAAQAVDSTDHLFVGLANKGNALQIKSDLSKALETYFQAAKFAQTRIQTGGLYISIADVYSVMGNHDNAVSYYQKSIALLRSEKDSVIVATVLYNLGDEYLKINNLDSALLYTTESQALSNKINYAIGEAYCLGSLGMIYSRKGDRLQAEINLNKAIVLLEVLNEYNPICEFLISMSAIYQERGDIEAAKKYAHKSLDLSEKYGLKKEISDANGKLSELYENSGDLKKALAYYKDYISYRDSVHNIEAVSEMADLRTNFEVSKKQKEVDLLATRNKLRIAERNGFIVTSFSLVALLATGFYFFRLKVKRNRIIAAQKLELDQLNAAKDKLFSIVSHDLRSSVNALKASNAKLAQNLAVHDEAEMKIQLNQNSAIANGTYNLLDNLLNWALLQTEQSYFNKETLRLFFVVEHTAHNYKALMLDKQISFENRVDKSVSVFADQESLKIILRNLFDNAIKFSKQEGSIVVYCRESTNAFCELVIEDSGMGMPEATRQDLLKDNMLLSKKANEEVIGTGLGMQLCKSLIRKNGGKFNIESQANKGTKMIVSLPTTKTGNHG